MTVLNTRCIRTIWPVELSRVALFLCMLLVLLLGTRPSESLTLSDKLLSGYDKRIIPGTSSGSPLKVTVDVSLDHIIDLNEKHQNIHTAVWIRLKWNDVNLSWNASKHGEYENITSMGFQHDEVWTPDIIVYNEIGLETGRDPRNFLITAKSDGSLKWGFPRSLITACPLDTKLFPYDHQTCNITIGSWAFPQEQMDIYNVKSTGDASVYHDKGEWRVKNFKVDREIIRYVCCPKPYTVLTFAVELERAYTYYLFNLVFPCILISLVNVFGFLLPVPSGERISLNITAFLGLVVFMIIVGEMMPPQADVVPNISVYFGISLTLIALANLLNVAIVHLHFRGSHGAVMSPFVRHYFIFKLGGRLFYRNLIKHAGIQDTQNYTVGAMIEKVTPGVTMGSRPSRSSLNPEDEFGREVAYLSVQKQGRCALYPDEDTMPQPWSTNESKRPSISTRDIDMMHGSTASLAMKVDTPQQPRSRRSKSAEWKVLGVILDRLFFIILLSITIINNLFVLFMGF